MSATIIAGDGFFTDETRMRVLLREMPFGQAEPMRDLSHVKTSERAAGSADQCNTSHKFGIWSSLT
jgi:hypothetical protein